MDVSHLPAAVQSAIQKLSNDIEFIAESKKGANGYVFLGKHKILDRSVAVKFYYWDRNDHAEPKNLAKLEHENIIGIFDASAVDDDFAYFVMPLCEGGDLDAVMEEAPLDLLRALDVCMQIARGTSFLHAKGYLHRDLKPLNVFCDSGRFLIGDFGSVIPCNDDGNAVCFTKHSLIYRPPETFGSNTYSKLGDIYQIGILLYQVLGGRLSYVEGDWLNEAQKKKHATLHGFDKQDFANKIIEAKIVSGKILDFDSLPAHVPESLKSIIRKSTRTKPEQRYTSCADLHVALNNARGKVMDWRFDDDGQLVLHRKGKQVRIRNEKDKWIIEKDTGSGWRRQHSCKPSTLAEASKLAEQI